LEKIPGGILELIETQTNPESYRNLQKSKKQSENRQDGACRIGLADLGLQFPSIKSFLLPALQPVPEKMRIEMLVEMQIEILNCEKILVNCQFKLNPNLILNFCWEIQKSMKARSHFEFVPRNTEKFGFFDFLATIQALFKISICQCISTKFRVSPFLNLHSFSISSSILSVLRAGRRVFYFILLDFHPWFEESSSSRVFFFF